MSDGFFIEQADDHFQGSGTDRPYAFKIEDTGKKYHVVYLANVLFAARLHFESGKPPSLCNMTWFAKDDPNAVCDDCKKPPSNPKFKSNRPQPNLLGLGFVLELMGKKVKDKEYEENPVKIIAIPGGKGKVNHKRVLEAKADGELLDGAWEFSKDPEAGFMQPVAADLEKVIKKLGSQFDRERFEAVVADYRSRPVAEIQSIILSNYGNMKWDHPLSIAAGLKNPFPEGGAATTDKPEGEPDESDLTPDDLD